ncbi:2-oxoglutarate ferredoxin oxidoreductase subunit delta [Acholeplasma morum]|uniref:4Fe-4S dicluster domain-containing protein n=1 Tax=Paracholeplasma morum TaxID=264637 RepID=UPI00195D19D1|nr:4Fe-4S dicluster domain-containing protein [Paracholeplasma morum]MBM7452740.1 2-oxoglutarate ferredoxin oxidoreductase subunit delta [Paracholeplasma morum]
MKKYYSLDFNNEFCKGCELCVNNCPVKILEMSTTRINQSGYQLVDVTDIDKCIGCAFCAMICPDSVIKVETRDV